LNVHRGTAKKLSTDHLVSNMDIQEFVRESLSQIIEGVHAFKKAKPDAIPAHLVLSKGHKPPTGAFAFSHADQLGFVVEFDLAVTTIEKSEASGKVGIAIVQVLSGRGEKSSSDETVSATRIKFSVPISYAKTA
jgi:hypothetical protein